MPTPGSETRAPQILIVDRHEWSSRSLESVLTPNGYIVMRAFSAQSAFQRVRVQSPDLVFISSTLPNDDGINLCQTLRSEPQFGASLPILFTSPERPTLQERRSALRAGAWEIVSHPFDVAELLLKLEVYVRARLEIDAARGRALVDEQTGLYNAQGLERRATEIQSQARRAQQALACVVLSFAGEEEAGDDEADAAAAVRIAQTLKRVGRGSDAIGRLGQREFAVVAPSTNAEGAAKLAHRLATAIRSTAAEEAGPSIRLRAGYDAVPNAREATIAASDLLVHATVALRDAQSNGDPDWIQQFQY